jgi:thiol-disulfide isomerase/thioredoxin
MTHDALALRQRDAHGVVVAAAQPALHKETTALNTRHSLQVRRRLLSALLLGLAAGTRAAFAKTPGEVEIGQALRDATLLGLNGPNRRLAEFRGRPLIINVWASWCGPCRQEMASLERLAWANPAAPFAVIGISTDDYPEKAQRLLKATNATISHFIDRQLLLENMLGAAQLPLTVLVDASGRVVDKIYGARQWDGPEAQALIAKAFRMRSVAPAR